MFEEKNQIRNDDYEFVKMLREHYSEYHNHKETMAHAGLLVQIALVAGIFGMEEWPPRWVMPIFFTEKWMAFLSYFVLWVSISVFICWQLYYRYKCAVYVHRQIDYLARKANATETKSLYFAYNKKPVVPSILIVFANILILLLVVVRTFLSK